jgi:phosphatidylserine/phosphatidylglycerophosphate/cardiolipin synthase-like enzyme
VTSIGDEDLRLLANCIAGDGSLFDQVRSECTGTAPSSDPTASAIARFITSRFPPESVDGILQQLRGASATCSNAPTPTTQLCLTMPVWLHPEAFGSWVATTEVAMINVILHAKRSLKLAFPFIDAASRNVFKQLEYAWRRGCSVQILCRDFGNVESMGLGIDFEIALAQSRDGAACRIPTAVDNVKWTFHAKVLIADESSAYVGSANLTRASLADQAEVGILVSDPAVLQDLRTWYSSLWSALV